MQQKQFWDILDLIGQLTVVLKKEEERDGTKKYGNRGLET